MKKVLPFAVLIAVAGGMLITSQSFAFGGEGKRSGSHEEVKIAVEAQDYSLIPTDLQERITVEKFAEMIERSTEKEAKRAELEAIVQSGDFVAFKSLKESSKAEKEARKLEKYDEKLTAATTEEEKAQIQERFEAKQARKADRSEKTDEELQEKFNEIVTYYNENGELPKMKRGKRGGKGMRRGGNNGERTRRMKTI